MKLSEEQERWINQLEELWNFLEARLKSYKLSTHDLRLIVLLHMVVAAHRLIRGFLAQLKGGSNDNLQSKLRTLTEATINVNYILADATDNRAKAFILDSTKSRIRVLDRIINLLEQDRAPSMAQVNSTENYRRMKSSLEQELFEQQNLFGRGNITWPPLEQRAKRGNSEELYVTVFGYFSQDTHNRESPAAKEDRQELIRGEKAQRSLRRRPCSCEGDNRGTVIERYDIISHKVFIERIPWV